MPSGYLQLIIDPHLWSQSFEQGDILSAASHLMIRRTASSRICFKRLGNRQFEGLNGNGFLPNAHLIKDWHEACCEFRFERLNRTQCKQIRLSDMAEITITTGVPHTDLRGKPDRFMDVDLHFNYLMTVFRRQNAQGAAMFSDDGDELKVVMYGGASDMGSSPMDTVWTAITTKTGRLEADEIAYDKEPPFGRYKRRRIVLRVDDFTDGERGVLESPILDLTDPENAIVVKKRKSFVDWEGSIALSGNVIDDIRNDSLDPNLRVVELNRSVIVSNKSV